MKESKGKPSQWDENQMFKSIESDYDHDFSSQ